MIELIDNYRNPNYVLKDGPIKDLIDFFCVRQFKKMARRPGTLNDPRVTSNLFPEILFQMLSK